MDKDLLTFFYISSRGRGAVLLTLPNLDQHLELERKTYLALILSGYQAELVKLNILCKMFVYYCYLHDVSHVALRK